MSVPAFLIRRIPLAHLYRNRLILSLECSRCGHAFTTDYHEGGFTGRRGLCPKCGTEQKLRPHDLRMALERSFRSAERRVAAADVMFWNDVLALTIIQACTLLEPILMTVVVRFRYERIGHYLINTVVFLKRMRKWGWGEALLFALPPHPSRGPESNTRLGDKWRKRFIMTPAALPAYKRFLAMAQTCGDAPRDPGFEGWKRFTRTVLAERTGHAADLADVSGRWEVDFEYSVGPENMFLAFSEPEKMEAGQWFETMKIPPNALYACFLGRDQNYLDKHLPDTNWNYHSYRNVKIKDYLPAMNWLADRGIVSFRMGSDVLEPLGAHRKEIVDYAVSGRTELMDLFLSSNCLFFVTCGTGIDILPDFLGKWVLYCNYPQVYLFPINLWSPFRFYAPKKLWSHAQRRFLSFREELSHGFALYRTEDFLNNGVSLVDHSKEDVLLFTQEMYARATGTWTVTDEELELRDAWIGLLREFGYDLEIGANLCFTYLRKNPHLLADARR